MSKLLTISNGKVEISPEALLVREFKSLWDRDKSKDKHVAEEELSFVYHFADPKSAYLQFPNDDERIQMIRTDILTDQQWWPDEFVQAACDKYRQLFVSEAAEFLGAARKALHSIKNYFLGVDFNKLGPKGEPIYKIRDVTGALKEAEGILTSIQKLQERVDLEEDVSLQIKGGGKRGIMEDPDGVW